MRKPHVLRKFGIGEGHSSNPSFRTMFSAGQSRTKSSDARIGGTQNHLDGIFYMPVFFSGPSARPALFCCQMMRLALLLLAAVGWAQPSLPPSDLNRVVAGTLAPDFELPSAAGGNLKLSSLRGKNVVLVFYRGRW